MPLPIRLKTGNSPPSSRPAVRTKGKTSGAVPTAPSAQSKETSGRSRSGEQTPGNGQNSYGVRVFKIADRGTLQSWYQELDEMRDVLLGRIQPPMSNGIMTLMEVADAYYGRAKEIEQIIHRAESEGSVVRGSRTYKFRTGELRSFIEMAKGASELGSRRLTDARLEYDLHQSI
jgi:hypothetical protein